jgi:phospholipid/cholesterol/gamma-HCH transport system permease protein
MAADGQSHALNGAARRALDAMERTGKSTLDGVSGFGYGAALFFESVYWVLNGKRRRQPVRIPMVFEEMMQIGIRALPIVTILSLTIGVMLAIQGIHTLKLFGAESRVTIGIALSITREFSPLITGILVAGRSGSALAARLGTMNINQEIDALRVMGIDPVRFLVAPPLIAMMVMLPALTFWSDLVALFGAGVYVSLDLGMSLTAYTDRVIDVLKSDDLMHGLGKSAIFAVLITLVGVVNGATVKGGAEGLGRATTRSVVQAITAIVITDMIFVFVVTR